MTKKLRLVLICFLSILIFKNSFAVVFEKDSRIDTYESQDESIRNLAKSVFTFIPKTNLKKRNDGSFEFTQKKTLKEVANLCSGEKFEDQYSVGTRCSGFLATENIGITAGHCVSPHLVTDFCQNYYIIFDYVAVSKNEAPTTLSENSVYECKNIPKLIFKPEENTDDYAAIEFSKAVPNRKPLEFRKKGKINNNENLFMIGHPRGLPQKISLDAKVLKNENASSFSTNLDCLRGNSGSPVFNAKTLIVEGIFVRGDGYIPNNSEDPNLVGDFSFNKAKACYQTLVCLKSEGCTASMDATRATQIVF